MAIVQLFGAALLPGAVSGATYTFDVTVQAFDAEGNNFIRNTDTISLTDATGAGTGVPEPSVLLLLCAGLCLAIAVNPKRACPLAGMRVN
jgi:hypothetical protein